MFLLGTAIPDSASIVVQSTVQIQNMFAAHLKEFTVSAKRQLWTT